MFTVAGRTFRSRLILGTGKYKDFATMKACYLAAGWTWSPWRCGASTWAPRARTTS